VVGGNAGELMLSQNHSTVTVILQTKAMAW